MKTVSTDELFDFFQTHQICESLIKQDVSKLVLFLQEKDYKGGEILSDCGEVGDFLGFVIDGSVELISGLGGEQAEVGKQKTGTFAN